MNNTKAALVSSQAWSAGTSVEGAGATATSTPGSDIAPGADASGVAASWATNPVHKHANKKNE